MLQRVPDPSLLQRVLVLPDDAKKVDWDEEDSLWARLQGRWQIVYVSGKPSGCCSWTFEVCFNKDHTQQEITGRSFIDNPWCYLFLQAQQFLNGRALVTVQKAPKEFLQPLKESGGGTPHN